MQTQIELAFDQLIKIVKQLPPQQWEKLKEEVELNVTKEVEREAFRKMLIEGPVFSEEQLVAIAENRKNINQWRTK